MFRIPGLLLLVWALSSAHLFAAATCTLSTTNRTVTICSPANGATVNTTFHVNAGSTDTTAPVNYMQVYVNGAPKLTQNRNFIDADLTLAPGNNQRFTVQAHDTAGAIFKTVYSINVASAPPVVVSPSSVTLAEGGKQRFTANVPVTWSATGGTIDSSGLYTAGNSAGNFTVTAIASDGSGRAGTASVTITGPPPPLTVTPSTATTQEGKTQQFTASAPATWSASCGTIDSTGLFTAPNTPGTCTITATATDGSGRIGTATDNVVAPPFSGNYTTWKNDNMRTGQQRHEKVLTPSNVNSTHFGIKFSDLIDGHAYAQPLYMSNLSIKGAQHNVVFVATEHDTVYAFDADGVGSPLWKQSFLINGATTVPTANVHSTINPQIGITGTPVIDPNEKTLFVVAETLENSTNYVFRLHALDVTTGQERPGSPVVISDPNFQPKEQLQRPALLLVNGTIYFAFGSQGDTVPWHGWIFAYEGSTLAKIGVWNATQGGSKGGIWMGGAGISSDADNNLYLAIGNGTWDGVSNFSISFVKLSPSLQVLDFFTPFDEKTLSAGDRDLSGGPLVVPDQSGAFPHELIGCGKPSPIYVVNRDQMGHFQSGSDSQIIQELPNVIGGTSGIQSPNDHCFMTPAYWEGNLYFIGNNDVLKAFKLNPSTGHLSPAPTSRSTFKFLFPGAQPVVSSNGSSNGIVWVVDHSSSAALHAYDATDMSKELYRSPLLGVAPKWVVPTVINGKVYVGTGSKLVVFGPM
jgi:hypothetical protein